MKRRHLLMALVPLPLAANPVAEVQRRLQQAALVRGRFEQDKHIAGFAKPLRSSGDYLLLRGKGLLWRTRQPFASQLALTRDAIRGDGVQLDANKEPGVRVVTQLMLALLDGNLAALEAQFTLQAEAVGAQAWRAQAQPRAGALAKLFQRIELEGDRQLRRIQLIEAQGDRTTIRFDEQQREPAAATPEEAQALG
ncbi:hypothetical protein HNQ51_003093 [Inhella inkyongensis]|uniref:Outer membrane lipoprotein carrier protein LolA n=1 Tax=Inhella inkyongensis TaxID=392593 RepID=A0A840S9U1_9BURK|nr:outer membrane lipoprotein carrier protein LolA [Inhella inkyongensis]MBB5205766.1 hypothetical protein [Inhella inkyongensis]